jgi:ABC-type nitrate/sulfonate/bicarbonate transport system ATPase subunit
MTLLMSIVGPLAPSSGQWWSTAGSQRAATGIVVQEYNKSLFAWRSVLGNVHFGLMAIGRLRLSKARHLIELVG